MPPTLSKQFAGLPRWAWLAILAGGLTVGLILRSRQSDEEEGEEEYTEEDIPYAEDIGDPYYSLDGTVVDPSLDGGSGGFYYQGPLPSAISPNVTVNIGGGNQTKRKCKKSKPKRKPPKGTHWACRNGKWTAVPNKHSSKRGSRSRSTPLTTGGGAPDRRNQHRISTTQAEVAKEVLTPSTWTVIASGETTGARRPAEAPVTAVSVAPVGNEYARMSEPVLPTYVQAAPTNLPTYDRAVASTPTYQQASNQWQEVKSTSYVRR